MTEKNHIKKILEKYEKRISELEKNFEKKIKNDLKNSKKIKQKCSKIKLILTDVDGVLTDGGMYYSNEGEATKKFNTRDGMGVELLLKNNIKTIFITKEKSTIAKKRGKKVKAASVHIGVLRKETELVKICKKFAIKPNDIAYIGDDVNDIEIMRKVGFSSAPSDSNYKVKKIVDYVCSSKGGSGAFRELADLILSTKSRN